MLMQAKFDTPTSAESSLDRQIEGLIAKIVSGTASDDDVARYHDLTRERVTRMQPVAVQRFRVWREKQRPTS